MVVKCPKCNHYISDNVEICPHCGALQKKSGKTPLKVNSCPHCGAVVNMGDTFCSNCGKKFEANDNPYNETSLKEKESIPDNYTNLASLAEKAGAKEKKQRMYLVAAVCVFLVILVLLLPSSNNNSDTDESNNNEYVLSGSKKFHGDVDKYPITMELQIDGEEVNGSLYYDKYGPENILILSGGLKKSEIELDEFEKNGKPTGHFRGKYSNGVFQGEYTTIKGKTMSFAVSEY